MTDDDHDVPPPLPDTRRWAAPRCGHRILQFSSDGYPLPCPFPNCGPAGDRAQWIMAITPSLSSLFSVKEENAYLTKMTVAVEVYRRLRHTTQSGFVVFMWVPNP